MREDMRAEQEAMKGMGVFGKMGHLGKRYGILGLVTYEAVFFATIGASYAVFSVNNNFGLDANVLLDKMGITETVISGLHKVGMAEPGEPLSPGATSVALAIVAAEASEIVRLPFVLAILPTLRRRLYGPG